MLPPPTDGPPESLTNNECIDDEVATTQRAASSELSPHATTTMNVNMTKLDQHHDEGHKRQREETSEHLKVEDSGKPAKRLRSSSEIIAKTLPAPDKSTPVVVTDDTPEIAASSTEPPFSRSDMKHGELTGLNSPSQKRLRNQKRWRGKFCG
jgi:ATP-dependent 26S proteasome regulatory subunit